MCRFLVIDNFRPAPKKGKDGTDDWTGISDFDKERCGHSHGRYTKLCAQARHDKRLWPLCRPRGTERDPIRDCDFLKWPEKKCDVCKTRDANWAKGWSSSYDKTFVKNNPGMRVVWCLDVLGSHPRSIPVLVHYDYEKAREYRESVKKHIDELEGEARTREEEKFQRLWDSEESSPDSSEMEQPTPLSGPSSPKSGKKSQPSKRSKWIDKRMRPTVPALISRPAKLPLPDSKPTTGPQESGLRHQTGWVEPGSPDCVRLLGQAMADCIKKINTGELQVRTNDLKKDETIAHDSGPADYYGSGMDDFGFERDVWSNDNMDNYSDDY